MPSLLADAAASTVFWVVLAAILLVAIVGYNALNQRVELFPAPTPDHAKIIQDWLPTGRIDFAGPSIDPAAADTPAAFYLQAEEMRLLISMSGIERREIRWRKATLNEAKRIVSVFHRQLSRSSLRGVDAEPLTEAAAAGNEDAGAHANNGGTAPVEGQPQQQESPG
jgi:hypothetical protein